MDNYSAMTVLAHEIQTQFSTVFREETIEPRRYRMIHSLRLLGWEQRSWRQDMPLLSNRLVALLQGRYRVIGRWWVAKNWS
jgi:hypothetical protein